MRALVAMVILLAGLGLAANVFRSHDQIASLDQIMNPENPKSGSKSGLKSGIAALSQQGQPASTRPAERKAASTGPDAPSPPPLPQDTPTRWQRQEVVVTYERDVGRPWTTTVTTSPPAISDRLAASRPDDPRARYELARTLQTELRRAGCYWGDIDGSWGTGSKRAMAAFANQVNSVLPSDEPDPILVRLVQSNKGRVCDRPCPLGQVMGDNGRCSGNPVLAGKGSGASRQKTHDKAPQTGTSPATPASTTPAMGTSPRPQETVPAPSPDGTVASAPGSRDEALTGRMSVGAPLGEEQKPPATVTAEQPAPSPPRPQKRVRVGGSGGGAAYSNKSSSKQWTQTIFNQLSIH